MTVQWAAHMCFCCFCKTDRLLDKREPFQQSHHARGIAQGLCALARRASSSHAGIAASGISFSLLRSLRETWRGAAHDDGRVAVGLVAHHERAHAVRVQPAGDGWVGGLGLPVGEERRVDAGGRGAGG